jgi:hypothetical protein
MEIMVIGYKRLRSYGRLLGVSRVLWSMIIVPIKDQGHRFIQKTQGPKGEEGHRFNIED